MHTTLLLIASAATASAAVSRRVVCAGAAAATSTLLRRPALAKSDFKWGPFMDMTAEQIDELGERSKLEGAGYLLPSGVRVIDLIEGTGPEATRGARVFAHYKVWSDGFRSGPVADFSFSDERPYDWLVGQPTDRMPAGADEGTIGMREGGWRRLIVPAAYGDAGLRRSKQGPGGRRYVPAKAPLVVQPGAPAYFDLIMVDAGSGRCDRLLRPQGVSEKDARKIKSMTCSYKMEIY